MIAVLKKAFHNNAYLIYLVLAFLFYGNSLRNQYSLDDDYVTVVNFPEKGKAYTPGHQLVGQGFKGIPKIWKSRYAHDNESTFDYRPVVTTSFAIEYGLFGQKPFISHLINVLLYFFCLCLLHICIREMFVNEPYKESLAFLCGIFFLIHPLHTEVVASLKSRDELLAFLFSMSALLAALRFFDTRRWYELALVLFFLVLGIYSKRTAIVFIAAIPMTLIFFRSMSLKKTSLVFAVLVAAYVMQVFIKKQLVHEKEVRYFYHFENPLFTDHASFPERILIGLKCLGFYVKMLLAPFPLRFYYGYDMFDVEPDFNIYSIIALVFLGASVWYYIRSRNKYFLFAFFLFLGTLFPFLNVAIPMPGIVGDRLSFMASFGFSLMLGIVLLRFFEKLDVQKLSFRIFTTKPFTYISLVSLVCLVYVFNRNSDWYSKLTLFEHDAPRITNSAKGNSLLANEHFERMSNAASQAEAEKYAGLALLHYNVAIGIDSSLYTASNNAGVVLYRYYRKYDEAARYFRNSIRYKPSYSQAFENLGNVYKVKQSYDSAIIYYNKAIAGNPQQYNSYENIGQAYLAQKKYEAAEKLYERALKQFPGDYYFHTQKANMTYLGGRESEGLLLFEEAFKLNPTRDLGRFLTEKYRAKGDASRSEYYERYAYIR